MSFCLYCNNKINLNETSFKDYCKNCDIAYFFSKENAIMYYEIMFGRRSIFARCYLDSGISEIYFWKNGINNNYKHNGYIMELQIHHYKWLHLSKPAFLEFIHSMIIFS